MWRYMGLIAMSFSAVVLIAGAGLVQHGPYAHTFTANLMSTCLVFVACCCIIIGAVNFVTTGEQRSVR